MLEILAQEKSVVIKQIKELVEFIGFETRNKYGVYTESGQQIGFAAEQQKGILGTLLRQILGHWRRFDIHIFDSQRKEQFIAHHPFRFYFKRLEVKTADGKYLGHMEKQFSVFSKKFVTYDEYHRESSRMYAGLFKIWSFPFMRNGKEIAKISKKWGGAMTEIFLDSDTFLLEFFDPSLRPEEKAVLLSAAVFVDLLYFENNQGGGMSLGDLLPN